MLEIRNLDYWKFPFIINGWLYERTGKFKIDSIDFMHEPRDVRQSRHYHMNGEPNHGFMVRGYGVVEYSAFVVFSAPPRFYDENRKDK